MIVEELAAKFGLEVDEAAFSKVEAAIEGLHHGLKGLVGFFGAAVVVLGAIVESVGEAGDHAARSAEKIGITTQALQGLTYAAHLADVSADSLQSGLKFLGKNAAEAAHGSTELRTEFARAGVAIYGADGKIRPIQELLGSLADHFYKMPAGAEKTALAMKLLGRSGIDMIPFLNKGSKAIEEMVAKAEEMGLIMDEETIKNAEEYADGIKEVGGALTGLKNSIGGPLLKDAAQVTHFLSEWIIKHRKVIASGIVKFVKGFTAAIGFLASGTKYASLVWFGLITLLVTKGLVALAAMEGASVSLGFKAAAAAVKTAAKWALAMLPFLALGALIVLIADELYEFATGGDTVLGELIAWFSKIDPTDNPMLQAFKALGALVFDITDPRKWDGFIAAAKNAAIQIRTAFRDAIPSWLWLRNGTEASTQKPWLERQVEKFAAPSASIVQDFSMVDSGPMTHMGPSTPNNPMGPSTALPKNWNITVNANTGASAVEIAAKVEEVAKRMHREALAALQGK